MTNYTLSAAQKDEVKRRMDLLAELGESVPVDVVIEDMVTRRNKLCGGCKKKRRVKKEEV